MDPQELQTLVEQVDKGELPDDHQVPVSVIRAIRAELKEAKDSAASKDDELLLYKTTVRNLQASGPGNSGQQNRQAEPGIVERFFEGRENDDVPTIGELKQFTNQLLTTTAAQNNENAQVQHIQSQVDFNDLVYKHFPNYLQSLPTAEAQELAREIQSIPSRVAQLRLCYRYGKLAPAYLAKAMTEKPKHEDARRIEENASKPRSTATVGASGAASSSDLDRINAAKPGTAEFRALQKEFVNRKRG
jgi:hypothetical protein